MDRTGSARPRRVLTEGQAVTMDRSSFREGQVEFTILGDDEWPVGEAARHMVQWWRGFGPALPRWKDYDFLDHAAYAPNLHLIRVRGADSFEFRVAGETVWANLGRHDKGVVIDPRSPSPHYAALARHFVRLFALRKGGRLTGILNDFHKPHLQFESVDLPILDENGEPAFLVGALANMPGPTEGVAGT